MYDIVQECERDYDEIYNVVKKAFESADFSDGNEHILVNSLRNGNAYIPELSIVARHCGSIVGHIMLTRLEIAGTCQLALAPLAVLPQYQKKGVGKELIQYAHKTARSMGYNYSVVLGSPEYYTKFGYVPASVFGIKAPFDVTDENFMAIELNKPSEKISGKVVYSSEFGI